MSDALLEQEHTVFSGGQWRQGHGSETLEVIDPSTGGVLSRLQSGSAEDVEKAARAASRAFDGWKRKTSADRAEFLRGFARGLESRKDYLMRVQMHNNGKPRPEAEIDVNDAIATFDYYATLAEGLDARQDARVDHIGGAHFGLVRHEPVGPVGMIVPWNFPLVTSAWKIAPALAAGCTAVMKTSEMTPLNELVYGEIAHDIGLPAGVLNIVTGAAEVGIALTRAPELRKISFTGSNMIGAKVMEAVAPRCLPVSLELGGKSPIVVTADADIDQAIDCIMGGVFFNAGQMCSATSRLIVDKSIEPKLIDALVEKTRALSVGSPFEDGTVMGPITTNAQSHKVLWMIEEGKSDGLDCVTGGGEIDRDGHFVKPTIFRDVPHDHMIWRDEIFGPVLATTTVSSDEEAVAVANDTIYGLVGSVVSGDWDRGKAIADRIEAGQVWINTPQVVYPDSAWGGFKQSGIGRELGPWGLSGYLGVKTHSIGNLRRCPGDDHLEGGRTMPPAKKKRTRKVMLNGLSEIFSYLRKNTAPIYVVTPTPYSLLGLDQWVGGLEYINYFDIFDGKHPRSFVPTKMGHDEFQSMEDVANYLVSHPQFVAKAKGQTRRQGDLRDVRRRNRKAVCRCRGRGCACTRRHARKPR